MRNRLIPRADSFANWKNVNPLLAPHELVFDTTAQDFKIGNGTLRYAQLPYLFSRLLSSASTSPGALLGATITEWEPGIYNAPLVLVLNSFTLYQLTTTVPFVSDDILLEIDRGLWTAICCDNLAGPPVDPALYLLTEDGRRILDEAGHPLTID